MVLNEIDPATLTPPAIDFEDQKLWPSEQAKTKPAETKPASASKPVVRIKPIKTTRPG